MPNINKLTTSNFRILSRNADFLDRKIGSRGEIFYDDDNDTLRVYDGNTAGGIGLAKEDLTNVSNSIFAAKAAAAGIEAGGGGNTTVSVGPILPSSPTNGNLWLNTNNGSLYVYINDGDSNQWIQPAVPTADLSTYATKNYADSVFEFYVAADDSTQIRINRGNLIQFVGAGGVTTSSDADGNITITGGGTTGNVTFSTTTIDTTDSSGIIFTPAVSFSSDITVENHLKTNTIDSINGIGAVTVLSGAVFLNTVMFDTDVTIGNELFVTSIDTIDSSAVTFIPAANFLSDITVENDVFANNLFVTSSINSSNITSSSSITLNSSIINLEGLATFSKSTEIINSISGATGTVVHDFSSGSLFFHSSIAANFTANFINVSVTNSRAVSIALILDQGATAYIPNAVQIAGSSQTIKWSGGSEPSGTNNYTDVVNFTLIRSGGAWTVLGSLSTYN
jgi:hypothetical protein